MKAGGTAIPWNAIGLAIILVLYLAHVGFIYTDSNHWMVDDAFISFRYAENFAEGKGLVFNAGERVEGYTNFLWVVLLAALYRVGFDTPEIARVMGVLFGSASILVLYLLAASLCRKKRFNVFALMPPLMLAACNNFALWSFGGLSYPMLVFLVVAGLYFLFYPGKSLPAAIFLSLSALTRPEGLLFLFFALLYLLTRERRFTREVILFAVIAAASAGGHLLFRLLYYGYPLPNSFYNKVGFQLNQLGRGLDYLGGFAMTYAPFLPALILAVFIGRKRREGMFLFSLTMVYLAYIVYAGGDPLPAYRLVIPIMPVAFVLLSLLMDDLACKWNLLRVRLGLFAFLAVLFYSGSSYFLFKETLSLPVPGLPDRFQAGKVKGTYMLDKVWVWGKYIGLWFEHNVPPGALLAVNTAGSIPYYARSHDAIDMLGLTDEHIAHKEMSGLGTGWEGHERYDVEYMLSRRPDYYVFGFSGDTTPFFPGDTKIVGSGEFQAAYVKQSAISNGHPFIFFKRVRQGR